MKKKLQKFTRSEAVSDGLLLSRLNENLNVYSILSSGFPQDLKYEKTLQIHVYDTTKQDMVNSGIEAATSAVANVTSHFFGEMVDGAKGALGISSNSLNAAKITQSGGVAPRTVFRNVNLPDLPSINADYGNRKLAKHYIDTFFLPIPNSLSEAVNNTYEAKEGWVNDMPGMDTLKDNVVTNSIGKLGRSYAKYTGARSISYYTNQIQMYTSTDFRDISLVWDLVPNNAYEARGLYDIIQKIKKYGSPESASGHLLVKSPNFFGLEFNNRTLNKALQFTEVVLVSASFEYVPGGNMETFRDNIPKRVQISLTFRDRMPKLREDWDKNPNFQDPGNQSPECAS